MEFSIQRETLLHPLQMISGAVEKKQTLPILSHVLIVIDDQQLSLTATDLEVELVGRVPLDKQASSGRITVPARKLVDICRTLPENGLLTLKLDSGRLLLHSGRSRFTLTTLAADDFPAVEDSPVENTFTLSEANLRQLIEKTHFAMAQQDVRYYLNGLLFDINQGVMTMVATDGHRLALASQKIPSLATIQPLQVIIPRKGILELMRLLSDTEKEVSVIVGQHHVRVVSPAFTFTSKLIEGRFPDFHRVIPKNTRSHVVVNREELKQVLVRVAVLSHDKYRGVRVVIENNSLKLFTHNSDKETAEEELTVDYTGPTLDLGFNVNYLLDVLSAITTPEVVMQFIDANSSILIEATKTDDATKKELYVIMPMRL